MFDFVNFAADKLQLFLLVMLRATGLFLMSPILSNKAVPTVAKVGMIIILSIILVATLQGTAMPAVMSLAALVVVAAKELLVGLSIGFVFSLLLMGVQAAGGVVSYQIGFSMAEVVDPSTGVHVATLGQFWMLLATLIFLALNGHHLVISAFSDSYQVIPVGTVALTGSVAELAIQYSAYVFVIALKIAAPVIVTLLLTDVALGALSRLMPTMNVFIVGFGLKVGLGIAVMAISLPVFAFVIEKTTTYLNQEMGHLLVALGRA
ncbi:MAG TPA: flagellar biosynthetic protein FliR [Candidatus Acidoferrum sp.]|nr:flagellar biosynthetic protein FliR [Candidatus Acidoferrum sp.]